MMSLFPSMCAENLKIDLKALLKDLSVHNYHNNHIYYREFSNVYLIILSLQDLSHFCTGILFYFSLVTFLFRNNSQQSDVEEKKKASD